MTAYFSCRCHFTCLLSANDLPLQAVRATRSVSHNCICTSKMIRYLGERNLVVFATDLPLFFGYIICCMQALFFEKSCLQPYLAFCTFFCISFYLGQLVIPVFCLLFLSILFSVFWRHQWELVFVAYSVKYYAVRTASYLWNLNSWGHCLWWFPHLSNLSSAFPISSHTCLHFFPFFDLW